MSKIISVKKRVRVGILEITSNSTITSEDKINCTTVGVSRMEERLIAMSTGKKLFENNFDLSELDST
jgi:hypothetical protein